MAVQIIAAAVAMLIGSSAQAPSPKPTLDFSRQATGVAMAGEKKLEGYLRNDNNPWIVDGVNGVAGRCEWFGGSISVF